MVFSLSLTLHSVRFCPSTATQNICTHSEQPSCSLRGERSGDRGILHSSFKGTVFVDLFPLSCSFYWKKYKKYIIWIKLTAIQSACVVVIQITLQSPITISQCLLKGISLSCSCLPVTCQPLCCKRTSQLVLLLSSPAPWSQSVHFEKYQELSQWALARPLIVHYVQKLPSPISDWHDQHQWQQLYQKTAYGHFVHWTKTKHVICK